MNLSVLLFKMNEMKTTVLYAFILISSLCIQAQEFNIEFQHCYGGSNWDGPKTVLPNDSGFYLFGNTSSNDGDVFSHYGKTDFWFLRADSNGNIVWEITYGGSGEDYPSNMLPTPDGGFMMFGETYSNDGDVGCNHSNNGDWWLVKTDSLGNILWSRCYGGTHKETASQMIYANDGGYVLTGKTGSVDGDISHNNGQYDVWVVKVDWEGEMVWERTFGGSRSDWANGIGLTSDGGYVVGAGTGSSNGDVNCSDSLPSEWSSAWVIKLNTEGQIEWQKCYGGTASDVVVDIMQTSEGGYIFLGQISSNDGDIDCFHGTPGESSTQDMWVVKLDETGEIEWNRCLGGSNFDVPRFIRPMDDGGYLIGGNTTSRDGDVNCNQSLPGTHTVILYKLTAQGEIEWRKCLGSQVDNSLFSIHIYTDYHFLLGATTRTNGIDVDCDLKGETDIWIVEIQDTTVGMKEIHQGKLMIFPNPAATEAWLQLPANNPLADMQIELYSPTGRLLYKAQPVSNFHKIETAQLPVGLYVVRMWDGSSWQSGRLVVR
jgi:hypothetical protein